MPLSYLVIGGEGFVGRHVVQEIRARKDGSTITIFDIAQRTNEADIKYVIGDITKFEDVYAAMDGITAVIHTASPVHGSSAEICWKVNVEGTKNVIRACQERGVTRLVVTSSGSVIFNGDQLVNADESTPYPTTPVDVYTESKIECEKITLAANGQKGLYTCTIRPSAIFGPGDRQLIPGMMEVARKGQNRFQIGDNTALMDFTYVGNVAYAHVLAAEKLEEGSEACGQAFNLTNGTPIPFWDFASRLWAETEYHIPKSKKIVISYNASMVIAIISESVSYIKSDVFGIKAAKEGFTRARIKQAMSPRYFNIEKARSVLGYEPKVGLEEGIILGLEDYRKNNPKAA